MFSSSFIVFSNASSLWVFNMFLSSIFYYMFPIIFNSFLHRFLHHFLWFPAFHTFSILILIQEFYLTPSFSDPFCTISSRCYHIFLHFHCIFSNMFTASSWFAPSIRSGFLHFPRDFPWFVPGIRAVFVRFPGDFVRFPLIVIMFSCSFIGFSNTSSWSLRPPKRRT